MTGQPHTLAAYSWPTCYATHMRIATGTVVNGKVVVDRAPLAEGSTVTVVTSDSDDHFTLNAEDEAKLLIALEQAKRGKGVDGDTFLDQLDT